MKPYLLYTLVGLLSLCSATGIAQNHPVPTETYVEVPYFHGTQRCATCKAIEKETREVVFTELTERVARGELRFREVDLSTPEGEKLADQYRVTWSSLYVNLWKEGRETRNHMTRFGFQYARSQSDVFRKGLTEKIEQLLK